MLRTAGEVISDVFWGTSAHGRARVGLPVKSYISSVQTQDTTKKTCQIDNRDGWWEKVINLKLTARFDDNECNSVTKVQTRWLRDRCPPTTPWRLLRFLFCLFGFYGISTFVGYLMPNPFYTNKSYFKQFSLAWVHSLSKTFLFQAIQFSERVQIKTILFSISIGFVYTQLNVKIVLFQITQFSSIRPIDRILSGATTLGQSGPGSDGNEGVLCIH